LLLYKKALTDIQNKLSEIYRKFGDKVTFAELVKYNRLNNIELFVLSRIVFTTKETTSIITAAMKTSFQDSYMKTNEAIKSGFKIEIDFGQINPDIVKAALNNPLDRVKWKWKGRLKGHTEKAIQQINNEITQGIIQGKGYAKTAAAIKEKMNNLANNSLRITRTETHRVATEGRLLSFDRSERSFKKLGIKTRRVMYAVLDNRTREQSNQMHGQVADEEGYFTYPNEVRAKGPGLTGIPEYDINDREVVVVEIVQE
jgi:hypothetical protein